MPAFETLDEVAEYYGIEIDEDMEWYDTLGDKLLEEGVNYQELDDGRFYVD